MAVRYPRLEAIFSDHTAAAPPRRPRPAPAPGPPSTRTPAWWWTPNSAPSPSTGSN